MPRARAWPEAKGRVCKMYGESFLLLSDIHSYWRVFLKGSTRMNEGFLGSQVGFHEDLKGFMEDNQRVQ